MFFFFCLSLCVTGAGITPEEVEQSFLKFRTSITSAKLTVRATLEHLRPVVHSEKWTKVIWFTSERSRFDTIRFDSDKPLRETYCENCQREGYYVYFSEKALAPELHRVPVLIQRMHGIPGTSRLGSDQKFDPKVIGISTSSFDLYPATTLSSIIGRTDRHGVKLENTKWRDHDTYTISYHLNRDDTLIRTTYAPDLGYCIVKVETSASYKGSGTEIFQSMETEPEVQSPGRVWFPRVVTVQHFENGKKTESERLEIENLSFNTPISSHVFKLEGMEIPSGAGVQLPDAKGTYTWDGKQLVKDVAPPVRDEDNPPPERGSQHTGLFLTSVALAVAGLFALGIYYLRARRKEN